MGSQRWSQSSRGLLRQMDPRYLTEDVVRRSSETTSAIYSSSSQSSSSSEGELNTQQIKFPYFREEPEGQARAQGLPPVESGWTHVLNYQNGMKFESQRLSQSGRGFLSHWILGHVKGESLLWTRLDY